MKKNLTILLLGFLLSNILNGQTEEINKFFNIELKEISTEYGSLNFLELNELKVPEPFVTALSDQLSFYYAVIKAEQFGVPVLLEVPLAIHENKIAAFLPNDDIQKDLFIELISMYINANLDQNSISERLFRFIRPVLLEYRTMENQNYTLSETNIQINTELDRVNLKEIGTFHENGEIKGNYVIREVLFSFNDNKIIGIK